MFGVQRNWHVRAAAVGGVVLIHVVVIISILQRRAEVSTDGGSREMFLPVIHEGGGEQKLTGLRRKPNYDEDKLIVDDTAIVDGEWRFPPADIWPSHVDAVPGTELSSFTGRSATPLNPVEPPPGSKKHVVPVTSTLRLLRWMRPNYSPDSASAGEEGTALLRLHISASGKPLDIHLAQSTGFGSLDQSALQAARAWTFSPPLDHSQPVSTWAEIEVRYHAQ